MVKAVGAECDEKGPSGLEMGSLMQGPRACELVMKGKGKKWSNSKRYMAVWFLFALLLLCVVYMWFGHPEPPEETDESVEQIEHAEHGSSCASCKFRLENTPIRSNKCYIAFDFDLTISTIHMFKEFYAENENEQKTALEDWKNRGKSIIDKVFGGSKRVRALSDLFAQLRKNDCQLFIISFGYTAGIEYVLKEAQFLEHFEHISGRSSSSELPIDKFTTLRKLAGADAKTTSSTSAEVMALVDDDPKNIEGMLQNGRGGFWVQGRKGLRNEDMDAIELSLNPAATTFPIQGFTSWQTVPRHVGIVWEKHVDSENAVLVGMALNKEEFEKRLAMPESSAQPISSE